MKALLLAYLSAIFLTTLIIRKTALSSDGSYLHRAEWLPFWSWYEVLVHQDQELLVEILLNILLFLPLGCLLRLLRFPLRRVFCLCLLLVLFIEALQYILSIGLAEWDDVLDNTLGGVLGYCLTCALQKPPNSCSRKSTQSLL